MNRLSGFRLALLALAAAGAGIAAPEAQGQLLAGVDEDAEYVQVYDFARARWVRQFLPADSALDLSSDGPSGLAVDEANGVIWWNDGSNLYRADYGSSTTTFVADMTVDGALQFLTGLEFVNGVLYGTDNAPAGGPEGIYSIDTTTGVTTLVLDMTDPDGLYFFKSLAFNPVNNLFYGTSEGVNGVHGLYSLDVFGTGAVTFVTGYANTPGEAGDVDGLAIGVEGGVARAYFVHDQVGEYAVYNLNAGAFETPIPSLPLAASEFNAGAAWAPGLVAPVVDNDLIVRIFDDPDFVVVGSPLTYTVEVVNNGSTALTNVTVSTTLDARTSYASSTMGAHDGSASGGLHTVTLPTLAALDLASYEVVVNVDADGQLMATVTGSADEIDPDTANNTATAETEALAIPVNDECAGAIALSCGQTVQGDTRAATSESLGTCGTTDGSGGGVWYTITGTGAEILVTTCNPGSDFNTKVRVWEGTCDGLVCVDGNDNSFDPGCQIGTLNQFSKLVFPTNAGQTYYILVHGLTSATGHFELSVECLDPRGACCAGTACSRISQADCTTMGGVYQGDGTSCTPPTMTDMESGAFIDISGTGAPLGLADNGIETISTTLLGDMRIANDGAVAFASTGAGVSFTNASLPSDNLFGGLVEAFAVYWDDMDTESGAVYWQEMADRVIVQWHQRPHWSGVDQDEGVVFQAQFFAPGAPYRAQYVYADTTFDPDVPDIHACSFGACDDGASATIGWQNAEGDFVQWSANQTGAVVGRPCPCELDGASGVDVFDLLAYLDLWFANDPGADIDGTPGVDVFDLLAYLDCWFPASAGDPCGQQTILTLENPSSCP